MYEFRESLYRMWEPWRGASSAAAEMYRQFLPGNVPELERSVLASHELFDRLTRRYEKRAFGLTTTIIGGEPAGVVEEVVTQEPFCNLLHFRRERGDGDPRVLIVPPLAGHFATLVRGTVEALLPQHDVYVCDWANARDVAASAGTFDLDDDIDYVISFLKRLGPDTHVIGLCQAAVPTLAATSIMAAADDPQSPATLTLMAGPIDGRVSPTEVNRFATSHPIEWFERVMIDRVPQGYAGAGRAVYPGFIQLTAFMGMNPDRHAAAYLKFFSDLVAGNEGAAEAHRLFYDEYLTVMDLTAEFYLQTVRSVFQEHDLPRGAMVSRGRRIEPAAITRTALMTIEGERDDISGIGQTNAAHALCSSLPEGMRRHHLQPDVGHFGVFSGHHWRNEVMPQLAAFIRQHDRRD